MTKLNVDLYGHLLGMLYQEKRVLQFEVNPEIFNKYQLSSTIMSLAIPLNLRYTNTQKKRAEVFFSEFLPEGRNLDWLVQPMSHSERNTFGILRKYGRDIAGALMIYDPKDPASNQVPKTEPVDEKQIRYLMENMPQAALANSPETGKTSLGGVQGKILLAQKNKSWYRVHSGEPSTHILKPVVYEYPTMIYDEEFCMNMAFHAGLTNHPVWIESFDSADALVIERYDRSNNVVGRRIHQEDFNQVLGARGSEKYQEFSGKISAKRIAQTLMKFCKDDDVERFAAQLIFTVAVGNLDMHAKNVSILHLPDESVTLAPAYDHVPMRHHNTDGRVALAVGGEYVHANLSIESIVNELISWQCLSFTNESDTKVFIQNQLELYRKALDRVQPDVKAHSRLKDDISLFISNLLAGKSVGKKEDL